MNLQLIKDSYGRICWLGQKTDRPDDDWMAGQRNPLPEDADFHTAYPLQGGSVIVDRDAVVVLDTFAGYTSVGEQRPSALVALWYAMNAAGEAYTIPDWMRKFYNPEALADKATPEQIMADEADMGADGLPEAACDKCAVCGGTGRVQVKPRFFHPAGKVYFHDCPHCTRAQGTGYVVIDMEEDTIVGLFATRGQALDFVSAQLPVGERFEGRMGNLPDGFTIAVRKVDDDGQGSQRVAWFHIRKVQQVPE